MTDDDPVTEWIAGLKAEDQAAAEKLWHRYCRRVAGIAKRILGTGLAGAADEHDVAQSAFRSFFLRASRGQFPQLEDREDLWKLLATITIRKAIKRRRKNARQKSTHEVGAYFAEELAAENSHELSVDMREEVTRLVGLLDEKTQQVAGLLLQGHTNQEIADQIGTSLATIERKRKLIRETWRREAAV